MSVLNLIQSFFILFGLILFIYLAVYFMCLILNKFFSIIIVQSRSMEPTLKDGDSIIVLKYAYEVFLKQGQIIVLSIPHRATGSSHSRPADSLQVKRLAGMPGDENIIHSCLKESIPNKQIFVLSDNPEGQDSRHWGTIPLNSIRGIVIARMSKGKI